MLICSARPRRPLGRRAVPIRVPVRNTTTRADTRALAGEERQPWVGRRSRRCSSRLVL
ncbi:hypothetical protein BDV95DRAFT_561439, partial [Massariosphaeria phaeospora]